jgi:hypothetical protein
LGGGFPRVFFDPAAEYEFQEQKTGETWAADAYGKKQ